MSHKSYEGQSDVDYCIECAVKHSQTAKVLMREALQRAEAETPGSEGVKEKIRGIVEELSGMEDDTNTTLSESVTALNTAARDLRKFIYSSKAEIGGAGTDVLREIRQRVDALVKQSYDLREEEEICVPCVSPFVCAGDPECVSFLEKAAATGDKKEFDKAVQEARVKYASKPLEETQADVEGYGKAAAEKRKKLLEDIRSG